MYGMDEFYIFNAEGNIFRLKNCELFDNLKKPNVYEKGQSIYQQGDSAEFVYYLKKGKVQIFIASPNGSEKILTVFSEGSLFGKSSFFDKMQRTSSARAITKSEIIVIDKPTMTEIIGSHPEFAIDMLEYLSKGIRLLSNQIESLSFLQADKRIARFLVDTLSGSSTGGHIACTHDELANVIGVSRVTVSKILSQFVRSGWIITGYRLIQVINIELLRKFAFYT